MPPDTLQVPVCCQRDLEVPRTRLHLAVNVSDLTRSIEFYRILFGVRPARQTADYCKFELTRPPLVFSLIPQPPGRGNRLRHLAFPVHQPAEVDAVARRLSTAGLVVTRNQGSDYDDARQDAASVTDPDGNCWRIACRLDDLETPVVEAPVVETPAVEADAPAATPAARPESAAPISWEHRITCELPAPIPHADGSVASVRLEGTFNAALSRDQRTRFLRDVWRVLHPGGCVQVHGLVANRALQHCPALHGLAGVVRHVPALAEVLEELQTSGLVDLTITRYPPRAVFHWDNVELRELKLSAWKPGAGQTTVPAGEPQSVIYRGPWSTITTDAGGIFQRGETVPLPMDRSQRLAADPWQGSFLEADPVMMADNSSADCPATAPPADSCQGTAK
jgi:catechol 2,3-dioxygenase-like lactoylglutathione lyase family enzyme